MSQLALVDMPAQCAPIVTVTAPSWLPAGLRARVAGGPMRWHGAWSPAERRILRKRKRIPTSEWAERYRVVVESVRPGPWSNAVAPYQKGIMDASTWPGVETTIVCKCVQSGITDSTHNCIGSLIDQAPGPVMYVFPDRDMCGENFKDRILPMIQASPRLSTFLVGSSDDVSSKRIKLRHTAIYGAWSGSASRLGNKPIRYLVLDEIDKYQQNKNEASSLVLAEKRTTTYKHERKIWKISTPTVESGPIWVALTTEAQRVFDYYVRCPDCGRSVLMDFDRVRWPGGGEADPERVYSERLAEYHCQECGSVWDDFQRDKAVRLGEWRDRASGMELFSCLKTAKPVKIGFHLPAWVSPFVSLSDCARAFLKGLKSLDALKEYCTQYAAKPWKVVHKERAEDDILRFRSDVPENVVPSGAVALTAGIDTQDHGFYYLIMAWCGVGEVLEPRVIRYGFVEAYKALETSVLDGAYRNTESEDFYVNQACWDAMGHRTKEVYDWCIARGGGVVPIKGEQRLARPWQVSRIEHYPDGRPIPGGLGLYRLHTTFFKDALARKLEMNPGDPGCIRLHAGTETGFARQWCVEFRNDNGVWECPEGKANHYWDCAVYAMAAGDIIDVERMYSPEDRKPIEIPRVKNADHHQNVGRKRPSWFGKR
ncbi:terminase gpA endonuclease subunit [Desulfovibrio inopinatus]|uniref:terminase gpA endonuclease subunit n=1 Tax=Desulfovibrio inopinatus TaxID=102109 RepID=UPI0006851104|nr:terminase gpA endonuclease subunit [Desulfovibrio inopinatus]